MDTLSTRARFLRESAGISQREADRLARITRGSSGAIEREEVSEPSADTLFALARLYGVPAEWLHSGAGDSPDARAVAVAVANRRSDLREEATR